MPSLSRHLSLSLGLSLGLLLLIGSTRAQEGLSLESARELSRRTITALEARDLSTGLKNARELDRLLQGEAVKLEEDGLSVLRRMAQLAKLYELSAPSPEPSLTAELEWAWRSLSKARGQERVRYPNGSLATESFSETSPWFYPSGHRIVYRPTLKRTWEYPNGQRTGEKPTRSQEWLYPNGTPVASELTAKATWHYANGQEISFRPSRQYSWYYPNGRQISYRFGDPSYSWYYPDGTKWRQKGIPYQEGELANPIPVLLTVLEDSGWREFSKRKASPKARLLRATEASLISLLKIHGPRVFPDSSSVLKEMSGGVSRCYEEEVGTRCHISSPTFEAEVQIHPDGQFQADSLRLSPRVP